jgi:hypothetical protein
VARSFLLRGAVKELDIAGLKGVLGSNDEKPIVPDQLLEKSRTMSELVHRCADVRSDGFTHEGRTVTPKLRREKPFDRGAHPVDDGSQITGLVLRGALEFVDRCQDRPTGGVAEDDDEPGTETGCGELHTPNLGRRHNVASHSDNEQVAEPLIEDDLCWNSRVGAS